MIFRIFRITLLFIIIGSSTISFDSNALQTTVDNLNNDNRQFVDQSIDLTEFSVLIYVLAVLGFAVFILIYMVKKMHEALLQGTLLSKGNSGSNFIGFNS